jgi:hypothetical protein
MIPEGVDGSDGRFANPFALEGSTNLARYDAISAFGAWGRERASVALTRRRTPWS